MKQFDLHFLNADDRRVPGIFQWPLSKILALIRNCLNAIKYLLLSLVKCSQMLVARNCHISLPG